MNNEPVAWMLFDNNGRVISQSKTQQEGYIPLYTHPAKTLTDEEIGEVYETLYEMKLLDKYPLNFARAILRKAQEK